MAVSLGDIVVRFLGDVSDLHKGVEESTGMLGGFGGLAADVGKRAGEALVEIGVESVKMAGEFQQGLAQLVTGAGESQKNLGMVGDGIKQVSVDSATTTKALTDGMYMIESAGFHGAAGLDVLKASAEGARAGNANLATAASAVTTMMVDYSNKHYTATEAMNALIATEQVGKTHLEDLGRSMGAVLPLASSLGVSFPQVAGGIAVMTNAGMTAQHASQNLANALRNLAAPTAKASDMLDYVGLTAQKVKDTLGSQGLGAALQLVEEHVGEKFPAGSAKAVMAFKTIMGGATGYNVALMLGGDHMKTYEANVNSIGVALSKNAKDVEGFGLVQQSFAFQLDRAKMAGNALMITLGQALLPVLTRLLSAMTPVIEAVNTWVEHLSDAGGVISQVAGVFNSVFQPALSGVTTAVKPLTDTFDRATGVFHNTYQTAKPLLDTFDRATGVFHSTYQTAQPLLDTFDRATGVFHKTTTSVSPLSDVFKTFAENIHSVWNLFTILKNVVVEVGLGFAKGLGPFIGPIKDAFGELMKTLGQLNSDGLGKLTDQANALTKLPLMEWGKELGKTIGTFLVTAIKDVTAVIKFLAPYITAARDAVMEFAVQVLTRIIPIIKNWWEQVQGFIAFWKAAWPYLGPIVKGVWDEIVGVVKIAWAIVKGIVLIGLDLLSGNWGQAWTDMKDMLGGVWDGIKTLISGGLQIINGLFAGLPAKALAWGVNMITGFVNGIKSMFGAVGNAVSGVANTVKQFLGIHSPAEMGPLAEADKWAPNLVKMYAGGLASGVPQMAHASSTLVAPVGPRLTAPTPGGGTGTRSQTAHIHVYLGGKEIVSQLMPMVYDEARAMTGWRPVG